MTLTAARLSFQVFGTPVPQGSARAFTYTRKDGGTGARVDHDAAGLDAWRRSIGFVARDAIGSGRVAYTGAVVVRLEFSLPAPIRRRRSLPTIRPDVDKLARGVLDALTGIVWRDDGQVVELYAAKTYALDDGPPPGVRITVEPIHVAPPLLVVGA